MMLTVSSKVAKSLFLLGLLVAPIVAKVPMYPSDDDVDDVDDADGDDVDEVEDNGGMHMRSIVGLGIGCGAAACQGYVHLNSKDWFMKWLSTGVFSSWAVASVLDYFYDFDDRERSLIDRKDASYINNCVLGLIALSSGLTLTAEETWGVSVTDEELSRLVGEALQSQVEGDSVTQTSEITDNLVFQAGQFKAKVDKILNLRGNKTDFAFVADDGKVHDKLAELAGNLEKELVEIGKALEKQQALAFDATKTEERVKKAKEFVDKLSEIGYVKNLTYESLNRPVPQGSKKTDPFVEFKDFLDKLEATKKKAKMYWSDLTAEGGDLAAKAGDNVEVLCKKFTELLKARKRANPVTRAKLMPVITKCHDSIATTYRDLLKITTSADVAADVKKIDDVLKALKDSKVSQADFLENGSSSLYFAPVIRKLQNVRDTLQPPKGADIIAMYKDLAFDEKNNNAVDVFEAILHLRKASDPTSVQGTVKKFAEAIEKEMKACKALTKGTVDEENKNNAARVKRMLDAAKKMTNKDDYKMPSREDLGLSTDPTADFISAKDLDELQIAYGKLSSTKSYAETERASIRTRADAAVKSGDKAKLVASYKELLQVVEAGQADQHIKSDIDQVSGKFKQMFKSLKTDQELMDKSKLLKELDEAAANVAVKPDLDELHAKFQENYLMYLDELHAKFQENYLKYIDTFKPSLYDKRQEIVDLFFDFKKKLLSLYGIDYEDSDVGVKLRGFFQAMANRFKVITERELSAMLTSNASIAARCKELLDKFDADVDNSNEKMKPYAAKTVFAESIEKMKEFYEKHKPSD